MALDINPLTKRQKQTLSFISSFVREHDYSPSLREIARFLKTNNLSTAQYFVEELEKKGYLKKVANMARGIVPLAKSQTVPLLGYIAAGKPIEPIENPEHIIIPQNIKLDKRHQYYALKVKGDSMIDMSVLDGDTILIRHQLTAKSGEPIVAITEQGATLKILKKIKGDIYLEPRNRKYPTIKPKKLEIRGKFIGLIRQA